MGWSGVITETFIFVKTFDACSVFKLHAEQSFHNDDAGGTELLSHWPWQQPRER
jgi:hypothetical protein